MARVIRFLFAGMLLFCTTILCAQERHLGDPLARSLFERSSFAHGYIHGYERGFHDGDLDLQLGRQPGDPTEFHDYKRATEGYDHAFGPKSTWKDGYKDGFLAGYSDAVRMLPFRAFVTLRKAAEGVAPAKQASQVFDKNFRDGYEAGRSQGAQDGRDQAVADPIVPPCMQLPGESCDAFEKGFNVGYDDGYQNQTAKGSKVQVAGK
ncbi:MAG TPA: hypothetical protein VGL89_07695 [Candidatus Koribacter sp.]|jgi:hypothetical protein